MAIFGLIYRSCHIQVIHFNSTVDRSEMMEAILAHNRIISSHCICFLLIQTINSLAANWTTWDVFKDMSSVHALNNLSRE